MSSSSSSFHQDSKHSLSLDLEDDEDNERTLYTGGEDFEGSTSPASPLMRGMELDLSFADSKSSRYGSSSGGYGSDKKGYNADEEACPIQETPVTVVFELPDGSQGESMVSLIILVLHRKCAKCALWCNIRYVILLLVET
jgi:hypothetical protein